jgi:hypothetical protein
MDTNAGLETETPPARNDTHDDGDAHILHGAVLILIGLAFLADTADWMHVTLSVRFWPFIPLFFGVARLLVPGYSKGRRRSRRSAVWLLSIAAYGFISEYGLFGLDYSTSWPLLIIVAGLNMVLKSLEAPCVRPVRGN